MPKSSGTPENTQSPAVGESCSPLRWWSAGQNKVLRQLEIRGGAFLHKGDRRASEEKDESWKHVTLRVLWGGRGKMPGEQRSSRNMRSALKSFHPDWHRGRGGTADCPRRHFLFHHLQFPKLYFSFQPLPRF
ncbi:unnamed protein product [Nyctereutes procyonoides]|uniref:(raccoon dog) hypothetical protein n=1 Tax=Nyctereutes procyonoides TaxID=34880 RepID=A0A811Z060_NYCPR|nr:unnamed protein product [Nyctereutes procyonoides]